MGRGVFWGSATPPIPRGGAPALSNFGVPSIYVYTLRRRTTEFGVVNTYMRGTCFRRSAVQSSQGGVTPADPNFGVLPTYAYTV